ncbi:MAG: hypothetical protein ACT4OW_04185 [Nitrososphaerota archaeon]
MQTNIDVLKEKKLLIISLVAIAFGFVFTNLFDKEIANIFSNSANVGTNLVLSILSVMILVKNRFSGMHGKAWLLLAIGVTCWLVAEIIWMMHEVAFDEIPFPSEADFFWFLGYPAFFSFLILYIKPLKNAISKKTIIGSALASMTLLALSVYLLYEPDMATDFETIIAFSYPIVDSILLVPCLIGIVLFFKGRVNIMWILFCIGMCFFVVADMAYAYLVLDDTFYSGDPLMLLYVYGYTFLLFGVYEHIKIFNMKISENIRNKPH